MPVHRIAVLAAAPLALLVLSGIARGESAFRLGFLGCERLTGPVGSTVRASYACTLRNTGDGPGAQGWSFGVTADGASITSVTVEGTTALPLIDPERGLLRAALSPAAGSTGDCTGRTGAVSLVAPSLGETRLLPRHRTETIAVITVEAVIPAGGGTVVLRYLGGCAGPGVPVANTVSENGFSGALTIVPFTVSLVPTGALRPLGVLEARTDIGSPPIPGSTTFDGSVYTLRASGDDIWDGGDSFHFAYRCVEGDFVATARILSRSTNAPGNRHGRHGLMARWSTDPDSKHSMIGTTFPTSAGISEQDLPFHQYRLEHGNPGGNRIDYRVDDGTFPVEGRLPTWMRIVRMGDAIYSYLAEDADRDDQPDRWCLVGSDATAHLPPTLLVGMAVHSHQPGSLAQITFDRLSIEPAPLRSSMLCNAGATVFAARYDEPDEATPAGARIAVKSGSVPFRHPAVRGGRLQLTTFRLDDLDSIGGDTAAAVWHPLRGSERLAAEGFIAEFDAFMTAPPGGVEGFIADGMTFAVIERGEEILGSCGGAVPGPDLANVTSLPRQGVVGTDCGDASLTFPHEGGFFSRSTTGGDIWSDGDSFHWDYAEVTGDFDIAVRAWYRPNGSGGRWGKYGLMARWSTNPAARYTMVQAHAPSDEDRARQAGRRVHLEAASTYEAEFPSANARPSFLRLTRRGNVLRSWVSNDLGLGADSLRLDPCDDCNWIPGPADDWGSGAPRTILVGFANSQHVSSGCGEQDVIYEFLSCRPVPDVPSDLVGAQGGALGYEGWTLTARTEHHPSFAVEMDNWIGGGTNEPFHSGSPVDPGFYHFGLDVNASVSSLQNNANHGVLSARWDADRRLYVKALPDIFAPLGIHVTVQYNPSGRVTAVAWPNEGPRSPRIVLDARIPPLAGEFLVGFTAGTGAAQCTQEVDNLVIRRIECRNMLHVSGATEGITGPQGVTVEAEVDGVGAPLRFEWTVLAGTATLVPTPDPAVVRVVSPIPQTVRVAAAVAGADGILTEAEHAIVFSAPAGGERVPTDCNQDGVRDISDAICVLGHLFVGVPARLPCGDGSAADPANRELLSANGDDQVDLSDAVYLLAHLFLGGPPPVQGVGCRPIPGCTEGCSD